MNEFIEVERYELFREPAYNFAFDRRQFMKVFGGGLALIVPVTNLLAQDRQQGESGRGGLDGNLPQEIGAWIHVDQDGSIKVYKDVLTKIDGQDQDLAPGGSEDNS